MSQTERHQFQAEIQQVLDIVIHSLYTDREIFVRELVSNAADALEKLRFLQSSGQAVYDPEKELKISLTTQEEEGVLIIEDSGIGMTRDELVENLGTIAHSGSKAFLKKLAEEKQAGAQLIGQFGVGFYSAFMAASRVVVETRTYQPEGTGWRWESEGAGGYEISGSEHGRGTKITLKLKEDGKEFATPGKIEGIIQRYSNFVSFPIELNGKRLNTVSAIWARSKSEIKEEEYEEFYKYIGHEMEPPVYRLHFTADAPLAIQALLFVPQRNLESMGFARVEPEVNLYCRKILIQAKCKDLLPEWLRFVKGVVDSEDLPLNISRETMQDSTLLQKLNKVLTSRFLKFLEEQSNKDPDKYAKFYDEFGRFLKEGVISDFTHREAIAKLLRFESSMTEADKKTSLSEYISRMQGEQKEIYYLLAPHRAAAEASPYYEAFKSRGLEVLFLYDAWDEFVMDHLGQFDGKPLKATEKADVQAGDVKEGAQRLSSEDAEALSKWFKESLGESVREVRSSKRLVDSPAVVVDSDPAMTATMRRVLKNMRREEGALPSFKPDLEINPNHIMMVRLNKLRTGDPNLARTVAEQVLDNARLAAGLLEDPRDMVRRVNDLLERVTLT